MASLYDRNGNYSAQFYDADRSPQRKRLSLKTGSKKVARRLLADLEDAYAAARWDPWLDTLADFHDRPAEVLTLEAARQRFMDYKRGADLSEHTVTLYDYNLRGLRDTVGAEQPVERVTAAQIRRFTRSDEVARSTQRTRHAVTRALFNWLRGRGHMEADPMKHAEPPRRAEQKPRALRPAMLDKMIGELEADYESRSGGVEGAQGCAGSCEEEEMIWQADLWRFALYSGMRLRELARLRWDHLDLEAGTILIEKQKSGKVSRIPLSGKAREALPETGEPQQFVFRSPQGHVSERSEDAFANRVTKRFAHYRKAAGLPSKITFHSTRHGFCTLLAEAGKSAFVIKEAARHSSVEISQRYVKLAGRKLRDEVNDVFG